MKFFVVRSNDERDSEDGSPLYWSNGQGWVDRASATVFSEAERDAFDLPMGDCEWVLVGEEES